MCLVVILSLNLAGNTVFLLVIRLKMANCLERAGRKASGLKPSLRVGHDSGVTNWICMSLYVVLVLRSCLLFIKVLPFSSDNNAVYISVISCVA